MLIRLGIIVSFVALLVGYLLSSASDGVFLFVTKRVMARMLRTGYIAQTDPRWSDGSLRVVACGTGTPLPDKSRASQCVYVAAGEQFLIFDTGDGSAENLALYDLPLSNVTAILLTHFHSDHIADFGEVVLNRWLRGATKPVLVYGPKGVEKIVNGYSEAYELDRGYRIAHHTAEVLSIEGSKAIPKVIEVCGADSIERDGANKDCTLEQRGKTVIDENGVKVTAFLVHHEPARPAYGYRVDYNGRSVTITGDTVPCNEVRHFAQDSDILIHDAINHVVVSAMADGFKELGGTYGARFGKMLEDIQDYHSDPDSAIDIAADAKVRLLVMTHMVPPRRNALLRRISRISWGTRRERNMKWKGEWIEGDDAIMWELPPAPSEEIVQTWRYPN